VGGKEAANFHLPAASYVCVDLVVYSATSFENRDDLSSSNLAGVSRSTATPANSITASVHNLQKEMRKTNSKIENHVHLKEEEKAGFWR
jgi:hypothetical protein